MYNQSVFAYICLFVFSYWLLLLYQSFSLSICTFCLLAVDPVLPILLFVCMYFALIGCWSCITNPSLCLPVLCSYWLLIMHYQSFSLSVWALLLLAVDHVLPILLFVCMYFALIGCCSCITNPSPCLPVLCSYWLLIMYYQSFSLSACTLLLLAADHVFLLMSVLVMHN